MAKTKRSQATVGKRSALAQPRVDEAVEAMSDGIQAAVTAERERLYSLFSQAPVPIAIFRSAGFVIEMANPAACELWGIGAEHVVGQPLFEVVPELAGQGYEEALAGVLQSGTRYEVKEVPLMVHRQTEQELRFLNFSCQPVCELDGTVNGLMVVVTDVTAQVRARQTIAEREAYFRFLAESMPQKVFTTDADGETDYFNPQWLEFTGLSRQQIREGWASYVHPDDLADTRARWDYSIETGEPFAFEHRFRRYDGQYRWHISRAHALHGENGKVVKWFGSCTDVHEIKRALEREHKLQARAVSLIEQRSQLVLLNRAKDEFISLASHQLRTPATAVKQYLGMVLEGYVGEMAPEQREMIEQAFVSNERQITIVNDLLRVARIDAGKIELSKSEVEMAPFIQSAIDDSRDVLQGRQQTILFEELQPAVVAHVDRARLRMVLDNLIDNASKYSREGTCVRVRLGRGEGKVQIAIIDQGVGIAPRDKVRLFRKFSRLDNPLSMAVGGSGLGLYWAKKVVDLHDGTIEVSSRVGEGSAFTIIIPL